MYVVSAISMWFLRAWKIGEIEQIAAEQGKAPEEVNAIPSELQGQTPAPASMRRTVKSSIVKRLFAWKRV
jgi:hypothetical protein